jgi:hypothetical protein
MPAIDAANRDSVRLRFPVCSPRSLLHSASAFRRHRRTWQTYFFFGEAFFEAFNGSSVVPPANPRRSRGGAFAFEIRT